MRAHAEHVETHFMATNFVRDVVIGMADGLTVPFALAAGLSGAVQDTRLIVVGGLAEIARVFQSYGMTEQESTPVVEALCRRPDAWVDFMMRFELGLEEPDPRRALISAATIAGSYIAGGMIPLSPYVVLGSVVRGLVLSAVVTLAALGIFGYLKGRYTGTGPLRSASQTMVIGGLAAAA